MRPRLAALPPSLPPRGLARDEAAAYLGISTGLFDRMVTDGRMPPPKRIDGRSVWDRHAIDRSFDALPDQRGQTGDPDAPNPWDTPIKPL